MAASIYVSKEFLEIYARNFFFENGYRGCPGGVKGALHFYTSKLSF